MSSIAQEIKRQADEHQESMKKVLAAQTGDLSGLRQQFDQALQTSTAEIQVSHELIEFGTQIKTHLYDILLQLSFNIFHSMESYLSSLNEKAIKSNVFKVTLFKDCISNFNWSVFCLAFIGFICLHANKYDIVRLELYSTVVVKSG